MLLTGRGKEKVVDEDYEQETEVEEDDDVDLEQESDEENADEEEIMEEDHEPEGEEDDEDIVGDGDDENADNIRDPRFPQLTCRCNMLAFKKLLLGLNDVQKQSVVDMGFGYMLDVKITRIPSRLAYWLVDNFKHNSCELKIRNDRMFQITEEDVYRVYGFPRGNRTIERFERKDKSDLYDEWLTQFENTKWNKISMEKLRDAIGKCHDGGLWFKRLFMVAIQSSFMETTLNGYAHPYILNCREDVDNLQQWNWADYVMRCLVDSKNLIFENKASVFIGPIIFLMIFYVDTVRFRRIVEPRNFPIINNWNTKKLTDREKLEMKAGFFGDGMPLQPTDIVQPPAHVQDQTVNATDEIVDLTVNAPKEVVGASSSNSAANIKIQVLTYARKIASMGVKMMEIIESAPLDGA